MAKNFRCPSIWDEILKISNLYLLNTAVLPLVSPLKHVLLKCRNVRWEMLQYIIINQKPMMEKYIWNLAMVSFWVFSYYEFIQNLI